MIQGHITACRKKPFLLAKNLKNFLEKHLNMYLTIEEDQFKVVIEEVKEELN